MRTGDNRVATVLDLYDRELNGSHSAGEVKAIVRTIFHERLGWNAIDLELRKKEALSESELLEVYLPLKRIRSGEPLQYILGTTVFHGLKLAVAPGVLIPRPETEELVERIISSGISPKRIIDIGTGSGCIALALKKEFPLAQITGVDVSPKAISIAQANAERLDLKIDLLKADILDPKTNFPEGIDLIVSNPPYVPLGEKTYLAPQVRDHEPHLALFVEDEDPLKFYSTIADHALRCLQVEGVLWFEGHYIHSGAVAGLLEQKGFRDIRLHKDISGQDRFIQATR